MSDNHLILTRRGLYELAWSKPMTELARDFGISDVALAKRCRNLHIPVPGRGYWARVDAGQTPHRPALPEHKPSWRDANALTVSAPSQEVPSGMFANANLASTVSDIRTRLEDLQVSPTKCLPEATAAVKRTALALKHTRQRELPFARGEKTGAILDLRVSSGALDRALFLADALMRAAASLGWSLSEPSLADHTSGESGNGGPHRSRSISKNSLQIGDLMVEGERIAFRIEERMVENSRGTVGTTRARERGPRGHPQADAALQSTGALRLVRIDRNAWSERRKTWYDRRGRQIEEDIPEILQGFLDLALELKARRIEDERRQREREEDERQRRELQERQEANAKLVRELERQAGAWHRARYLRLYVRTARRAMPQGLAVEILGKRVDFLQWAEEYINGLDPLHEQPSTEDMQPALRSWGDSSELKSALSRVLGLEWADSWKNGSPHESPEIYGDDLE